MKQISLPRAALLALLNTGACEVRKQVANGPAALQICGRVFYFS